MSNKPSRRNPPRQWRFKKGVSGNPKGRPKRKRPPVGEIVSEVQNTPTAYREGGRTKRASRLGLVLKKLVNSALEGDVRSADLLFKLRAGAENNNSARIEKIIVEDWVPDFPSQTDGTRLLIWDTFAKHGRRSFMGRTVSAIAPKWYNGGR